MILVYHGHKVVSCGARAAFMEAWGVRQKLKGHMDESTDTYCWSIGILKGLCTLINKSAMNITL